MVGIVSRRDVAGQDIAGGVAERVVIQPPPRETLEGLVRLDRLLAESDYLGAVQLAARLESASAAVLIERTTTPVERHLGLRRFVPFRATLWDRFHNAGEPVLRQYRKLFEPSARQLLAAAAAQRDRTGLAVLAQRYSLTEAGGRAALLLGEVHLQQRDWNGARRCWTPLLTAAAPLAGAAPPPTATASPITAADVLARLTLVSVLEGNAVRASQELDQLRVSYPDAAGWLVGRQGPYVETLDRLSQEARDWPAAARRERESPSAPFDLADQPAWSVALPGLIVEDDFLRRYANRPEQVATGEVANGVGDAPGYRGGTTSSMLWNLPVLLENGVAFRNNPHWNGVDIRDIQHGKRLWDVPPGDDPSSGMVFRLSESMYGTPTLSLGAVRDRVVVRANSADAELWGAGERDASSPAAAPALYILDASSQLKLLRRIELKEPAWLGRWMIAGDPVVDEEAVYVLLRRRDAVRSECYAAAFAGDSGELRWRTLLCAADSWERFATVEALNDRPLLSGDSLYCLTNLGAAAALDRETGAIHWLTVYPTVDPASPRTDANRQHLFRHTDNSLLDRGVWYLAPRDSDRLMALDAATGTPLWLSDAERAADATHLLGVYDGTLIATGDYVYWLDAATGNVWAQFPEPHKAGPDLLSPRPRGHGRGMAAGDSLYWPVADRILVFGTRPAAAARWTAPLQREIDLQRRGAAGGHLLWSPGLLLIAAETRLYAFATTEYPARGSD